MVRPNLYLLACQPGLLPFLYLALYFHPHSSPATSTAVLERMGPEDQSWFHHILVLVMKKCRSTCCQIKKKKDTDLVRTKFIRKEYCKGKTLGEKSPPRRGVIAIGRMLWYKPYQHLKEQAKEFLLEGRVNKSRNVGMRMAW